MLCFQYASNWERILLLSMLHPSCLWSSPTHCIGRYYGSCNWSLVWAWWISGMTSLQKKFLYASISFFTITITSWKDFINICPQLLHAHKMRPFLVNGIWQTAHKFDNLANGAQIQCANLVSKAQYKVDFKWQNVDEIQRCFFHQIMCIGAFSLGTQSLAKLSPCGIEFK